MSHNLVVSVLAVLYSHTFARTFPESTHFAGAPLRLDGASSIRGSTSDKLLNVFRHTACRRSFERAHVEHLQTHNPVTATTAWMIARRRANCQQQAE